MAEEPYDDVESSEGLRSFWTGAITFGLVTVPVALHSATRSAGTSMRMIGPDDAPVHRRYVCSKDDKVLDADDIVRGYEIEKGKFVVVTDDELEAIEPKKSREIDLRLFVDLDAIDPMYFERAYFLVPAGGTNKAYRLLAEVMEKKKQAGLATFVMRAKEYLVAIIAENGILRAETLRFEDELRDPESIGLPDTPRIAAAEVRKFESQITRHTKKLAPSELVDDYAERMQKLVAKKDRKKEDVVRVEESRDEKGGEVIDLMAALTRSLGSAGTTRKPPKRASARTKKKRSARRT